jgi:2-dehydropantoate 2-reductase
MSINPKPRIVIAGTGSLGSLIGGLLAEGGLPVTLLTRRPEHPDAIARQGGLKILGHGGDRLVPIQATADAALIQHADVFIFLCKALATRETASNVTHLFEADGAVALSFQNGLGHEADIASVIGAGRVIGGLTALGARLERPGVVRSFAALPSTIGELEGGNSPRASAIASAFTHHGLATDATADIMRKKWVKLFANVAFSATSGATGLSIAEVAAVPDLRAAALKAIDEAADVAAAAGIAIGIAERLEIFETIANPAGAGANTTSMYRDLAAGRPIEVEAIYGSVIRLGDRHHIPTPTLRALAAIIKGQEMVNAKRAKP